MRKKLSLLSVIIKSKQKIQVIKLWKEPGNNWAIELGMTNPRPLEQSLTQSKILKIFCLTKYHQTFILIRIKEKLTFCSWCCSICCWGVWATCSCCCLAPSMPWYHTGLCLDQAGFHTGRCTTVDPAGRWDLVLPAPPLRHRCCSSPTREERTSRNQ